MKIHSSSFPVLFKILLCFTISQPFVYGDQAQIRWSLSIQCISPQSRIGIKDKQVEIPDSDVYSVYVFHDDFSLIPPILSLLDRIFEKLKPGEDKVTFVLETGSPTIDIPPQYRYLLYEKNARLLKQFEPIVSQMNKQAGAVANPHSALENLKQRFPQRPENPRTPEEHQLALQITLIEYLVRQQERGFDIDLTSELVDEISTCAWNSHLAKREEALERLSQKDLKGSMKAVLASVDYLALSTRTRGNRFKNRLAGIVKTGRKVICFRGRGHHGELPKEYASLRLNNWAENDLTVTIRIVLALSQSTARPDTASTAKQNEKVAIYLEYIEDLLREFLGHEYRMKHDIPTHLDAFLSTLESMARRSEDPVEFFTAVADTFYFLVSEDRQSYVDATGSATGTPDSADPILHRPQEASA
ncbi:MAG: hypothetical protein JW774_08875 [Candidatus Aureabacteria bacterium]|nr:hypothetical protein [Candidatus Auribacterota bacterium]